MKKLLFILLFFISFICSSQNIFVNYSAAPSGGGDSIPQTELVFWYKTDVGVTLSGDSVKEVDDQSGNGWDLMASSTPTFTFVNNYVNGKPAFYANNKTNCLSNSGFNSFAGLSSFTIYFVGKVTFNADNVCYGFGSSWLNRGIYTYANLYVYLTLSGSALLNNYPGYYNNWKIYTFRFDSISTNAELLIDGISIGTNAKALSALSDGITWGGVVMGFYGYTTEFFGYKQYNSNDDLNAIVLYLKTKYGL